MKTYTVESVPLDLWREICEGFWQDVCREAAREGYYNEVTGGIVRNYERGARVILERMKADAPKGKE